VERAFRLHADGQTIAPGVLGAHVDGGGFHVKTAGFVDSDPIFVAKVNANFPANPQLRDLPTIQGVISLFDPRDGRVLAIIDSIEITAARTAAASSVAAKFLAHPESSSVTICGCGEQGRSHLRSLGCVLPIERVIAFDIDQGRARRFAAEMSDELGLRIEVASALGAETRDSKIWVTCTPSKRWFVGREHVAPGTFIAAVGADNPEKHEIEPHFLAQSVVIVDILEQCESIGDLHHAIESGVMRRDDVHASLADVVSGKKAGRLTSDDIVVFDSTGTALQDAAAAQTVYRRALTVGRGLIIDLAGHEHQPQVARSA
jgi:ornithine cyclodeaminase/alanine dehydrogenase-like protein (mu-crystallin family)